MSPKIELPRGVHCVKSRGKIYYYFQPGRGTPNAGARVRLPDDPRSPEFWAAVRALEGVAERTDTIGALIDAYIASWPTARKKITPATQSQYRRYLAAVRDLWGNLPAEDLRPAHVEALMVKVGDKTPGRANNILYALRSMCSWARGPVGLLHSDPVHGVKTFDARGGHEPWTDDQLAFAEENLTGTLRRAYFLAHYTGQRASDIVRMGWTDISGDTISLRQKKTGVRPVCPIFPDWKPKWRLGKSGRDRSFCKTAARTPGSRSQRISCGRSSTNTAAITKNWAALSGTGCGPTRLSVCAALDTPASRSATPSECRLKWWNDTAAIRTAWQRLRSS